MPDRTDVQEFPKLPSDFRDAAELVQKQFAESIQSLDARTAGLGLEERRRKGTALTLKVISVLSSLIIATGFVHGSIAQILGGTITGMAALERVFANLSRLLAVAAARSAYERVRRQVVALHNQKIIDVVKYRDRDAEKSADMLISFVGELRDLLAKAKDEVETQLANNAYESLGRLTLDEPHQGKSGA